MLRIVLKLRRGVWLEREDGRKESRLCRPGFQFWVITDQQGGLRN